jgi:NADH:ubiquinone oxidoreductase subunit 4 (subunit M)
MSDEKLNANTTLDKVLGYVDSPFKLFAIILMGVIAFAGYFLWQNQTFMMDAYKESKKLPEINTANPCIYCVRPDHQRPA